jgi:hypothetical protein
LGAYIDADDDGYPADNYPQAVQLAPTTVGCVPVVIKPDTKRVLPLLSNGGASEFAQHFTAHRQPVALAA